MWDTLVIGSGISGLVAGAALARQGQRVLLVEQHTVAGGLTQTFRRQDWTFATGVHYLSGLAPSPGPGGEFRRLLDWLTDNALDFAPSVNPYDIVRLPDFEFAIPHPESAYRDALRQGFPDQGAAIERWFDEIAAARSAAMALAAARGMPSWLAWALRWWKGDDLRRFTRRTVADALADIDDPRLRAVLGARGGDYGGRPSTAPLLEHALVTSAYEHGAWYPIGGPSRFAEALLPTIRNAGGDIRLGTEAAQILVEGGRARGALLRQGRDHRVETAAHVVSTIGIANTLACLGGAAPTDWKAAAQALGPGHSYIGLYLGFDDDIAAAGASSANHWIYESEDIDRVWCEPADEDAPSLFVSFPSSKDPAHRGKPTAEIVAPCDARPFARWLHLPPEERPEAYLAFKAWVEERVLAQFGRHFPALAPKVRFHEASTPVTHARFVRTPDGSMYGLEMTGDRLDSPALNIRTPVPGLLLAGQDVLGAGVQPSAISGLLAAAAVDRALLRRLGP